MSKEADHETLEWVCSRIAWPPQTHTGISSNALVVACALGTDVPKHNYPKDPSDLNRCTIAAINAPAHHKARAYEILALFTASVGERYPSVLGPTSDGGAATLEQEGDA